MIEKFLLDTNVVSELMRDRPAQAVTDFLCKYPSDCFYIADVVVAEIRFGISMMQEGSRRDLFNRFLDQDIRSLFKERILSADEETWLIWKQMEHEGRKVRRTYAQPDLVIAALGARYRLIVVTRDVQPFREVGLPIINPWQN